MKENCRSSEKEKKMNQQAVKENEWTKIKKDNMKEKFWWET